MHRGEVHIGFPRKEHWPDFDLGDEPARWFAMLLEKRIGECARDGFIEVLDRLRRSSELSHADVEYIRAETQDLYERVLAEIATASGGASR